MKIHDVKKRIANFISDHDHYGCAARDILVRGIESGLQMFFPPKCLTCRAFFNPPENTNFKENKKEKTDIAWLQDHVRVFNEVMALFICPDCVKEFQPVESPFCPICGVVFKSREGDDHLCETCIRFPRQFNGAKAVGVYSGCLMSLIHSFKYRGKIQLAKPLGKLLFSAFLRHFDPETIDFIVPVPLHIKRFRERGFNQAYLLIKNWPAIADTAGINIADIKEGREMLERYRWTHPQTGLGRKERIANIKGAFHLKDHSVIEGKRIVLVDDVYTTGTTANECAGALLKGGAKQVDVLTLARGLG